MACADHVHVALGGYFTDPARRSYDPDICQLLLGFAPM